MTTVERAISIAKKEKGYHEGYSGGHWNNQQKYSTAVPGLEWSQGMAWCATFVAWVLQSAGVKKGGYPVTASCASGVTWYKKNNRWSDYPAIGAQVFFGAGGGTHTGFVYDYDADYVYTIEGNTNLNGSAEGDGVYLKKRERRSSYTYGYGYPMYSEGIKSADPKWVVQNPKPAPSKPTPKPRPKPTNPVVTLANLKYGKKSDDIKKVQNALIKKGYKIPAGATGFFGDQTKNAYAKWQKSLGYSGSDADGIPGIKSLKTLGFGVK